MTTTHDLDPPTPPDTPSGAHLAAPPGPPRRTVLAAGIPALLALGAAGALGAPRPARLGAPTGDAALTDALAPHLTGHRRVAVALLDGEDVRFGGFGADEQREFEIGSVSKTFSGALVMAAIADGVLALESTVADVLGDEAHGSAIADTAIRQLVTHTSGLPPLPASLGTRTLWTAALRKNPYEGYTADQLIADALGTEPTTPGTFAYSNLGSALAGQLAARALGGTWQELLASRITEGLGMAATRAPRTAAELGADPTTGRTEDGRSSAPWPMDGMAPAGAIRSTAADMALYLRSMMDGTNPGAAGLEPLEDAGGGTSIGVAWFRDPLGDGGGTAISHNGQTGGFHSFCGWVPETGRGVVLLTDTATFAVDSLAMDVLRGEVA